MQLTLRRIALGAAFATACTLLGLGTADADGPWRLGLDTTYYTDTDNVNVVSPQVSVRRLLDDEGGELSARAVVDAVSAASVDIVAQASRGFSEVRTEAVFGASKAFGRWLPMLTYRASSEPDYFSNGGRIGFRYRTEQGDTTYGLSYGPTYDIVGRTHTPFSEWSRVLVTHGAEASVTQNISDRTLLRLIASLTIQSGYLAKPYRFVPLFTASSVQQAANDGVALGLGTFDRYRLDSRPLESVPDLRVGTAFAARLMQYIESIDGSLRLDYQFYFDTWGVMAHTIEPALYVSLTDQFSLNIFSRTYLQSAATFWQREYVVSSPDQVPIYRTLDRELSTLQTYGGGVRIEWNDEHWGAYVEQAAMYTHFSDFLYLDHRTALVSQVGLRWLP